MAQHDDGYKIMKHSLCSFIEKSCTSICQKKKEYQEIFFHVKTIGGAHSINLLENMTFHFNRYPL